MNRPWSIALGLGPLLLAATVFNTPAANLSPVAVTGFNRDVVIEKTTSGPPYTSAAVELNPGEGLCFYQSGLSGKSYGLPSSGLFTSAVGDGTVFQFQPYTNNNALVLSSSTGLSAGTLTLVKPMVYKRLALIANSASGGGVPNVTLRFSDGRTLVTTYQAPDWFNNSGYALLGMERISLSDGSTSGAPNNPRFYQTTLDLNSLVGTNPLPLVSLTFNQAAGAGSTAIYAISGEVMPDLPATITGQPANTTVPEGAPARFTAGVGGQPFPAVQWYRNGNPVNGATNLSLELTSTTLADSGAAFWLVAANVVSNVSVSATSSVATLTVLADSTPPVLLGAQSAGLGQVLLSFSERLDPASASVITNYGLLSSNGVQTITSASLNATRSNVVLTVAPMVDRTTYTVTVNNLKDLAAAGNVLAPNSQASFIATPYVPVTIGSVLPGTGQVPAGNGMNVTGGGAGLADLSDQFQFGCVQQTGDFDFMVRIESLDLADAWSQAGLAARETLNAGAREAAILATPTISGVFFETRTSVGASATRSGSFPVNYPSTWLRLKRAANQFTGFAGFDGLNWAQVGSVTLALPATLYLGFAVASANTAEVATAAFRDFAPVSAVGTNAPPPVETLGQCSRRTSLVISEIMYHPREVLLGTRAAKLEYVELFNSRGEPEDLSGFRLSGDVDYTFPPNTTIPGGGFLVVARSPADLQAVYGLTGVLGPWAGAETNGLPNDKGMIRLRHRTGAVFLEANYGSRAPWPVAPDGAGHSLVLAHPSLGEGDPRAWAASEVIGGSPGRLEPAASDPLHEVMINELLAHTDPPLEDYIELYNHSARPRDLSGAWLSDDPATNKFRIPDGTWIPAQGFLAFAASALGFNLASTGEGLFLVNSNRTRVLDAVAFGAQENGVSSGRVPDGGPEFYPLATRTPGTNNGPARLSPVVINEIMYHPGSGDDAEQYVELYNRSNAPVDLSGWRFTSGIDFTFPPNSILPAQGYLVAAKDAARLRSMYTNLTPANCVGDFGGKLSHNGERVALAMPHYDTVTNGTTLKTNVAFIDVNEVTYGQGGRWPQYADGGGSSLELIDSEANNRLAVNWADSDETRKAPWTLFSTTGTVDLGTTSADQLQVLLSGPGECLIDNVKVLTSAGSNLVANSTFESSSSGWTAEGTEAASGWETGQGYQSARSYHIRAVERGDNQVNRVRTPLTSALASGAANVTISAAVRWLKGAPGLLLRLRGNWLECAGEMALPPAPGTPGARNGRAQTNAPPAIYAVTHSPVLPAASQPVIVTARVDDPNGLGLVLLKYRLDMITSYVSVTMKDDGADGDAIAGDGVFSASIPGQAAGTLVAFYVQASDNATPALSATFPSDAPARECLVRVGELQPTGNFPVYRVWMTQATVNTWSSRNKMDNRPYDVTFVLNDQRVIYNAQALYAGSPYIAPGYCGPMCGRCGYSLTFPKDDLFLGESSQVLDWPGGHGNETSAMQEQMGYWIADRLNLPFSHRYTIRLHINGVTDTARNAVFEAMQQPASGYLKAWSPDNDEGAFFKIERAFEYDDSGSLISDAQPRLENFTTTGGVKKREKYRWNWLYRTTERINDYTNLFSLVDALNAAGPEPYTSATLGLVDMEEWMGVLATEHIIVNFDAYGHEIGKNMYAFLPTGGKWQLYMCDLDWLMLAAPQHYSSYAPLTAPLFNSEDPTITRLYNHPPFVRAYWRAVQRAVDGPLDSAVCNPIMDAKYRSLVANGIAWCDGQSLTDPTSVKDWFSQRRAGLQAQLATVASPFSVSSVNISNNVAIVAGKAPITVQTVLFNGCEWPVTWTSVSNWTARVVLPSGTNQFSVVGVNSAGQTIFGASNSLTLVYNGALPSPVGQVVINEILCRPTLPGSEYLELYNASTNVTFDMSGWEFRGLGYTFPAGALIGPRSLLVLTANRAAFAAAFGATTPVFDTFSGTLQSEGETLTLVKPGTNGTPDLVVAKVEYSTSRPWPLSAGLSGSSLQLVDPRQDNWRVGNWLLTESNSPPVPQWTYATATGTASSSLFYIYLQSAGDVYLDDIKLVQGSVAENGTNLLPGGDFEAGLPGPWTVSANLANSALSPVVKHSGTASLHLVSTSAGSSKGTAIWQTVSPALVTSGTYTLSFWYLTSTNGGPLTLRLSSSTLSATVSPAPPATTLARRTPAALNSVQGTLAPFPPLWINELQAENLTGITNRAGQRTAWLELFNPSTNTLSLLGLYLAKDMTNLAQWALPENASIGPGQFKTIFADGQPNLSTAEELHTSFALSSSAGAVALTRLATNGQWQVLDYITYTNLAPNHSVGSWPDGQSFDRRDFFYATPGATNDGSSAPLTVFINEWMADNAHTLADPADRDCEDWFELYNPGTNAVDLGGYYLSDTLTNKFQFEIPKNGQYVIPAGGFLLVWADGESKQNQSNRVDLHVNFKLDKDGEAIGLFGADGSVIDYVAFGPQASDVATGRFPDGSAAIGLLPIVTPRAANAPFNTRPWMAPLPDRELAWGETLAFTISATDTDLPPQTLTFSLDAGAAAGASLDSLGHFTWTPTNAPSTNRFSVVVCDDGLPSLCATQTFSVVVLAPPPHLGMVGLTAGQFTFSCPTVVGQRYQVEYKTDLEAADWTPLGLPVEGTGNPLVVTNSLFEATQQYFRVKLLPSGGD